MPTSAPKKVGGWSYTLAGQYAQDCLLKSLLKRNNRHSQQIKQDGSLKLDVSENSGFSPQIIHFNKVSIINHPFWGKHPYFWKHPF